MPVTGFTEVPVMAQRFHMLVSGRLGMELLVAGFAGNPRCPVAQGIHMLICGVPGAKLLGAGLTFVGWRPVIGVVHVLVASPPGAKGLGTGLAFRPVIILVHVFLAVFLVREAIRAAFASVHFGNG